MAEAKIYQTLIQLKEVADTVMNECYVGSAWAVDKIARQYPLMVIDSMSKNHQYKQGVLILNLDVYIVDIYNEKRKEDLDDYIIQIQSDMTKIGTDYINYLSDNDNYEWSIVKSNVSTFQHFRDKWADEVAGVKFDLLIKIADDGNYCLNIFENAEEV